MDVRLVVWLDEWPERHPGTYPTRAQAAAELHVSTDTIRRCERRLSARGYASHRTVTAGGRPAGLLDCDLVPPRPSLARSPAEHIQGDLFVETPPQNCQGFPADLPGFPGRFAMQDCQTPPSYSPGVSGELEETTTDVVGESSLSSRSQEKDPEIDPDLLADLVAEAVRVFGFDTGTAELLIRDTRRKFAAETRKRTERREWSRFEPGWMAEALRRAEAGRERAKVFDWGYLTGILKNICKAGGPVAAVPRPSPKAEAEAKAKGRREREQAEEREQELRDRQHQELLSAAWEALGQGERDAIRAAVLADNPALRRWPSLLEPLYLEELERRLAAPPAHENPAAGSLSRVPPPPVAELSDVRPATESYPCKQGSARAAGKLQTPHDAGQCASLPDHAKSASPKLLQTAKPPILTAQPMPGGITSHVRSDNPPGADPPPPAASGPPPRADPPDGAGWPVFRPERR